MPDKDDLPDRIFQRVQRSRLRRPGPSVLGAPSLATRLLAGAVHAAALAGVVPVWMARAVRGWIASLVIGQFLLLSSRL